MRNLTGRFAWVFVSCVAVLFAGLSAGAGLSERDLEWPFDVCEVELSLGEGVVDMFFDVVLLLNLDIC